MSKLKEKLKDRKPMAGTHITLCDPCIGEIMGNIGYDFVWVDTEHTPIDYHTLEMFLIGLRAGGTDSIVRVPWNDVVLAKRVLEMGPDGIIFPMINTVEEADYAMKSCMFPPEGIRGFGPIRACKYGLISGEDYVKNINNELNRFIMVETIDCVKNLNEIVKNPYIDGYFFGPNDLSGSIGELTRMYDPNTSKLIDEAVKILTGEGKAFGVSLGTSDPDVLQYWYDKGIKILSTCSDVSYIVDGANKNLANIRAVLKK